MRTFVMALLGGMLGFSGRAALPELVLPQGAGVNIHFVTGHEKDLDLIAAAGFKWVRMDFGWGGIERQTNRYDWAGYDELLANLEKRGLQALFILDYSNPLYEETITSRDPITGGTHQTTASPRKPESVAAFARWAGAAAKRYAGRAVVWEIWNEPNIHFWAPNPKVEDYTTLAKATCKSIKTSNPAAQIVAPATSGFPWDFLEAFFKSGILEDLDGVSVHPYRDYKQGPETAAKDYQKLRALIDRYAPPAKAGRLPILSGEWGYATHDKGLSLETQAAFAVRQQLANLLNGIPLSIWYDWKNDGPDPKEREHNFGIVQADLAPKPAYQAIQTLTKELSGYRVAARLPLPGDQVYALACTNFAGQKKLAAWTAGEPGTVHLQLDRGRADSARIVSGSGQDLPVVVHEGRLELNLTALPLYVTIGAGKE